VRNYTNGPPSDRFRCSRGSCIRDENDAQPWRGPKPRRGQEWSFKRPLETPKDIWIEALRRGLGDSSGGATGDIADLIGRAYIPPERYDEALEQGVVSEGVFAVCVQVVGTRGAQRADHTIGLMGSLRDARAAIPWVTHMVYATSGSTPIVLLPMLGRGDISRKGVIGVGALPEWREVLAAVKRRGHSRGSECSCRKKPEGSNPSHCHGSRSGREAPLLAPQRLLE
jgi:hypothetical protein